MPGGRVPPAGIGLRPQPTFHTRMGSHTVLFSRRYRAALLDYLLGAGEIGLTRAYELGRGAVTNGIGLLAVLQAHQRAVGAVLRSTRNVEEALGKLEAAEQFLIETLSPFELTYRGYVALAGVSAQPEPSRSPALP